MNHPDTWVSKQVGGNLTPAALVRRPIGPLYDELLSLTRSTKNHHPNPTVNIIEAEDSGTNDEEDIPDDGLSAPEIISKLKDLTPHGESLIPNFKDPPLFLFSNISGRYGPVTVFYDTGNSHCLFSKGTPENLYGVRVRKGPQPLGAVGGTTLWGGDSWATMPFTTKGTREILLGIEVDKITADFPMIDIQEATAEIKGDKPHDEHLQSLTVPNTVGGKVDILMGIQYSCHHPRLVHQLESGLAIYELRLIADSPAITAAIAGPHHSFNMMLEKVGDVGTMLAAFAEGMTHWRDHGPPAPQFLPLTLKVSSNSEMRGIKSSSDYDKITNLTNTMTCARHLSPIKSGSGSTIPPAPKKLPHHRDRLLTDTRDNSCIGRQSGYLQLKPSQSPGSRG